MGSSAMTFLRVMRGVRMRSFERAGALSYLWRQNPAACVLTLMFLLCATVGASLATRQSIFGFDLADRLAGPSWVHLLGTDSYGRDVLARVIASTRIAAEAFLVVTVMAGSVGTITGLLAGEQGGVVDLVASRLVELIQGFPILLLALAIVAVLGTSLFHALLAVAIGAIPDFFRVARSSAIELRDREFVLAARSVGVRRWRLLYSEMLPNMIGAIVVVATFDGAQAVMYEATLSFLGLGVQPPQPSFGTMISDAQTYMVMQPLYLVVVATCLGLILLSLNGIGDALSDYFSEEE